MIHRWFAFRDGRERRGFIWPVSWAFTYRFRDGGFRYLYGPRGLIEQKSATDGYYLRSDDGDRGCQELLRRVLSWKPLLRVPGWVEPSLMCGPR